MCNPGEVTITLSGRSLCGITRELNGSYNMISTTPFLLYGMIVLSFFLGFFAHVLWNAIVERIVRMWQWITQAREYIHHLRQNNDEDVVANPSDTGVQGEALIPTSPDLLV